jgi:hypothetical protein
MKQTIHIPIVVREDGHNLRIKITLDHQGVITWHSMLKSLQDGVLSTVTIRDSQSKYRIRLRVDERISISHRATYQWRGGILDLAITPVELEFWTAFFGKYVDEGTGDVDHIDLDVFVDATKSLFVTFKIPKAKPPVSADEARRLLGL